MSQAAQDLSVRPCHINPAEADFYITMAVLAGAEFMYSDYEMRIDRWGIRNRVLAIGWHYTQYDAAMAFLRMKNIEVEWKP